MTPRVRMRPYLTGLLGVALATVVRLPFEQWLEGRAPYALYFLPILYVSWSAGVSATIATTILSLLAAKYFFVPVTHSFAIAQGEWASLALFVVAALAMFALSRKAAHLREHAMRNERACRRAERGARAAIWEWNAESDEFHAVALAELFGLKSSSQAVSTKQLELMVHPEDRIRFHEGLARARESSEPFRSEFRVLHPTKGLRWFASIGEVSAPSPGHWVSGVTIDVTDRTAAEQAAAEQREWFEVTLRSIGDAVIASDRDGRVNFMNKVAEQLTGWSIDQAMHHPLAEVFRIINEKTREPVENPADKVMRAGAVIGLANHTALIARDGAEHPIADSAAPIHDKSGAIQGVILVFHDVSDERRAADEVAEQREWFEKTLESIGDGVIACDVCGRVVFINPVAEYLTGHRLDEVRGRDCSEVFRIVNELTRAPVESPVGRVLREGNVVGLANHTVLIASNGVERPIDDSGAPIRSRDGRIVGVVLVFRDVSEHRTVENEKLSAAYERERLLESERAARSEVERASRLKDEFVATLSHELRTPLNAILGWVHVLQTGGTDPQTMHQALDIIARNTKMQAQLISDLLDMSGILSGKLRLELQRIDIGQVLDAAIETVTPAAEAKEIELTRDVEALPPVIGDPARLQQIIWNLFSNAVKFTPQRGRVSVLVRRVDVFAEISVRDTGIGIRPEFLDHVFERFRQGDGSTARRFGGLGLGLSIVKQLVELHGGSVVAESGGEGLGATFRVRLPIGSDRSIPGRRSDQDEDCKRIANVALERLKQLRVLVVDDDNDTRNLVVRLMKECEADVTGVSSASEALQHLASRTTDIIICDIGMPGMDGYSLIQRIRRAPDPRLARVPAIALTAFARPEDRTHAMRSGYQAHLVKPVEPTELIATVASFARLMPGTDPMPRD